MKETAVFVDNVNQFLVGFSAYMCVACIGSLFYHSTKPGSTNTYSVTDVQSGMLQWYSEETGDDVNTNGMSLPQEQDMYTKMGFTIITLPVSPSSSHSSDIANITHAINSGYLLSICGAETGFFYLAGDQVPYAWNATGNHCIAATGIDTTGNFIVRDCASLVAADNFTPGNPQVYDNSKMNLISAVAVVPTWLAGPPTPSSSRVNFETEFLTNTSGLSTTSGIANKAWSDYQNGKPRGAALSNEFTLSDANGSYLGQQFQNGLYIWRNGVATWHPYF